MTVSSGLDERLALLINRPAGQDELLDKFVLHISDSILLKAGVFLAVYCWMWFRTDEQRDGVRRDIVASLFAAVIVVAAARALQLGLPFQQRPLHDLTLGLNVPLSVNPATLKTWSSFPSDHAVFLFALSVPIWSWSRWLGAVAFCWALFVVCLPRIYLGYHYPSDVLAGAILGVALMLVLRAAMMCTPLPGWIVRWGASHSRLFCVFAFAFALELATMFQSARLFGQVAAEYVKRFVA